MAGRDLSKAGGLGQFGQTAFVIWVFPGVHQHDGTGVDAAGLGFRQDGSGLGFVERFDFRAVDTDSALDFDDLFVQHGRQGDGEVEQAGAGLIADPQGVGETLVHQQQGTVAFALQQGVGGDSGAHFDGLDLSGRDGFDPDQPRGSI